jgi:hypothetical protein
MIRTPIRLRRLTAFAALAASLGLTALAAPTAASATTPQPSLPQTARAQTAATWLASQINSSGYIPSVTTPGAADLDATANAVLALASAGVGIAKAQSALAYLELNVGTYVDVSGDDGPGQLALLILDAKALGASPTSFGGTNLVTRLLATQRTTGTDTGLFGVQDPTYDGAYRQGLALAALAAAGTTTGGAIPLAEAWLSAQQCSDGGWTSYVTAANPCNGKPAQYEGPDTNSTALAVQGLEAQHALSSAAASKALHFLTNAQDADGGWGYEPNTSRAPGSTDPDSTALVFQALLSLGTPPSTAKLSTAADPVSVLDSFQLTSGSGAGAFTFPNLTGPDLLATYQALPALAGVTFAYDLGTPVVTHVGPAKGAAAGGTIVKITGSGFTEATAVHFGGVAATAVTVTSSTSLSAVSPPGSVGTVDITVTSPTGTSPATAADHFTYKA